MTAEVFYANRTLCNTWDKELLTEVDQRTIESGGCSGYQTGWYYWFCEPGCLPDCDPIGPFKTEQEAQADSKEYGWPYNNVDEK